MDRRVVVTQDRLVSTLRQLMQRYAWAQITVAQICQEAEIARSTFYSQFSSREELLELSIARLAGELAPADSERGLNAYGNFRFLEPFLHHVKAHRKIYEQNVESAAVSVIFANLRQTIAGLIVAELAQSSFASNQDLDKAAFLCGGMFEMIDRWNEDECQQPVAELAGRIDALARALL